MTEAALLRRAQPQAGLQAKAKLAWRGTLYNWAWVWVCVSLVCVCTTHRHDAQQGVVCGVVILSEQLECALGRFGKGFASWLRCVVSVGLTSLGAGDEVCGESGLRCDGKVCVRRPARVNGWQRAQVVNLAPQARLKSEISSRVSARPLEYRFTVARSALLGRSYYTDGSNAFCTAIYFGIACGSHNSVWSMAVTIQLVWPPKHATRRARRTRWVAGRRDDGLGAIIFVGNPLWTHTLWQTPTACGWRRPS